MNIKLKTHSLNSLEIPLETSFGYPRLEICRPSAIVGSVDQISEIGVDRRRNLFKPLTKFNDSVVRLRRNGHYRTSLQTVNNFSDRPTRQSSLIDRSIPKFSLRALPSLNELRRDETPKSVRSSWEKSSSWSWKSILRPSDARCPLPTISESSISHSISNYEVSSSLLSIESRVRYPSTPLLSSPLPTFDEEDEEEGDTTSIESTFRSCVDSLPESSTLSGSFTDELTSTYDLPLDPLPVRFPKRTRSSFCLLQ